MRKKKEKTKNHARKLGCKLIYSNEYLPPKILIRSTMNANSLINILIISKAPQKQIFTVCANNISHRNCLLNCLDN